MKKSFLYSVAALFMCLFASCSQEEIIPESGQGGKVVRMTVGVPGGAATRAIPAVEGSKLRCIMQVVDADNNALTGEGMRQVQEVAADKITFVFTAPEGDYKCLFWADFVTEVNTDNIYDTADLTNITYHKTDNAVFSPAADAFCGYVAHGTTTIQLKRPFAKISITPNNATDFQDYTALTVTYDAPSGFNMVTQTTSDQGQAVTFTNTSFDASAGAWFSSFLFAPANADKLQSAITMKLADASGSSKTLTIAADKVPLTGNFEINGKFDAAEGSNSTSVEVSFDDSFDKPTVKAPAIGDFYYEDGTWGATTSNANGAEAIGVIFHVENENKALDDITNYTGINFANNKVHGWVVALTQSEKTVWSIADDTKSDKIAGVGVAKAETGDYKGYANSKLIAQETNKAAYDKCTEWALKPSPEVAATGWYLPAIGQLSVLKDNIETVNTSLAKITTAQNIPLDKVLTNHWSSTYFDNETDIKIYQLQYKDGTFGTRSEKPGNKAGVVRPILTF